MLITVGIPTYRRIAYLQEAVESALNQTFDDYEILISQNPHPDPSVSGPIEDWCRQQAESNPKIRYRKNERNVGASDNLNAIADEARGEFVLLIGDDDRLLPRCLEFLVMHARDGIDIVFANHSIIDSEGTVNEIETRELQDRFGRTALSPGLLSSAVAERAAWSVSIAIAAALIRTSVLREYRFHPLLIKGDTEFFIRLSCDRKGFFFSPERVSEVRHHSDRASESVVGFSDLALALSDMKVSPELEAKKRAKMEILTRQGVSDALLRGQIEVANQLVASRYFKLSGIKSLYQWFCTRILPGSMGMSLFRRSYGLYRFGTDVSSANELGLEVQVDPQSSDKVAG
jgi:glycosyltransferase involved in cell wall biosynthesis